MCYKVKFTVIISMLLSKYQTPKKKEFEKRITGRRIERNSERRIYFYSSIPSVILSIRIVAFI